MKESFKLNNRILGIDFLKYICSFLVICIHMPFPNRLGVLFTPITRVAVPIFFIITGFFYTHIQSKHKTKQFIYKIFKLSVISNSVYFLIKLIINRNLLINFFDNIFNIKTLLKFAIFNESPFEIHLWYLGALFYVLIIVYFFESKYDRKYLYPLIPILLLADLIFGKYSLLIFKQEFPYILVRNFLFVGLPYFLIGDLIYKNRDKIKKLDAKITIYAIYFFTFTTLAERICLGYFNINTTRDHYISTTFLAIVIILFVLKLNFIPNNLLINKLSLWGCKYSMFIYIIHPLFIYIMNNIIRKVDTYSCINIIYPYIGPFIILIISTLFSYICISLKKAILHK